MKCFDYFCDKISKLRPIVRVSGNLNGADLHNIVSGRGTKRPRPGWVEDLVAVASEIKTIIIAIIASNNCCCCCVGVATS